MNPEPSTNPFEISADGRDAVMGDRQHRAWVGPPDYYDRLGALQFVVLLLLGMRENDTLLDLGCGSLRGGRFSLVYLGPGRYHGIDPARWSVEEGIAAELGHELVELKRPSFRYNPDFDARGFGRTFDYVMASGIFMHAAPGQVSQCFQQVAHVLAEDGVFVGAYLPGEKDSEEEGWTYPEIQRYRPATLAATAEEAGLRLTFVDAPHTLDHRWFVATRPDGARDVPNRLDLGVFSWTEYLADEVRRRGGTPHSLEHYLKAELNSRLSPQNEAGLMPQARSCGLR
ncbi:MULTISPECIES: SAM-dependent methyltransferase [unclassified Streptomyces]|uniref:SAM-dependent methyltransferase n=1 Tax=unclassified Streptomyces TaxID=2593676 RepID=UPI0022B6CD49|nr:MULTISPECIES: class I SAM-dependent methyltransferase [unclassified Streptomyces]MCZ7416243.1 class I SAM-dependent methyltransferase [Streptomyces sp. WMMC897]MCZ7433947.1 class I SAM-dependent methyltransferase [Streptomyces sp. WMMC1477]